MWLAQTLEHANISASFLSLAHKQTWSSHLGSSSVWFRVNRRLTVAQYLKNVFFKLLLYFLMRCRPMRYFFKISIHFMELTRWKWHHYGLIHNWICLLVIPDYKFAQIKFFDFRTWTYAKILKRLTQDPGDTLYHLKKKCLFFYQLEGKHWTKLISTLVQTGSWSTERSGFSLKLERFHVLGILLLLGGG